MDQQILCKSCKALVAVQENSYICPHCDYHFRVPALARAQMTFDAGSVRPLNISALLSHEKVQSIFPNYIEDLDSARKKSGLGSAIFAGEARLAGMRLCFAIMDFDFIGGSFGHLEGLVLEKITRRSIRKSLPLVVFTASGGARMQDGIASLQAMRTASANSILMRRKGIPLFVVMTNPTSGGITASVASLGNIIIAEKGAFVGFAGPSVIRDTIGEEIDPFIQSAEGALTCGKVDMVLHRRNLPAALKNLLYVYTFSKRYHLPARNQLRRENLSNLRRRKADFLGDRLPRRNEFFSQHKTSLDLLKFIRSQSHIHSSQIANSVFSSLFELHGDRVSCDDKALFTGVGFIGQLPFFVVYFNKGKNWDENLEYNFSMANAGGYRKILRILSEAEFCNIPLVCFVDTPGAFPGARAEQENSAGIIAELTGRIGNARVPVFTFVTGQGGSGGAIALASEKNLYMLDFSFFSVISPEGCHSILRHRSNSTQDYAEFLELDPLRLEAKGFSQGTIFSHAKDLADYLENGCDAYSLQIASLLLARKVVKNRIF
ncbi:MAG: hypothetical protein JXR63_00825 [Spirochaetales bacterium]|nr:hypothetical protein [Spirochaetales bacterium]